MDTLTYRPRIVRRGLTYSFINIPPSSTTASKPYILFLHGFPSGSADWRHQITHFSGKGYGVFVPDLLGYGASSKPSDTAWYKGKDMAADLMEILDAEGIRGKLLGVGHDWGSFLLSRMANYYPDRFLKYVFLDVGYSAPGAGLSLQVLHFIDGMVKEKLGYSVFGYFLFFNEEDAGKLMDEHPDSTLSLFHSRDEELGKKYLGAQGGFRTWLSQAKTAEWPNYLTEKERAALLMHFSIENGGFGPATNWYRVQTQGLNEDDEKEIPKENYTLTHPTLLFTCQNFITKAADMAGQMRPLAPDFTVKETQAGHWIMLELPDEVNQELEGFFEK
ncbi:alpha hydrolase-24 [Coleophoma cylindrospora]|uniref:Alpha hydrolase-24 n=1 Tax=Coleophoma cylindrospora TaxID=1849047 RepID=A0A3D8S0M1_9HELO|nr:alpha hydrolase-24 [Coleophoma cylindrospora]